MSARPYRGNLSPRERVEFRAGYIAAMYDVWTDEQAAKKGWCARRGWTEGKKAKECRTEIGALDWLDAICPDP